MFFGFGGGCWGFGFSYCQADKAGGCGNTGFRPLPHPARLPRLGGLAALPAPHAFTSRPPQRKAPQNPPPQGPKPQTPKPQAPPLEGARVDKLPPQRPRLGGHGLDEHAFLEGVGGFLEGAGGFLEGVGGRGCGGGFGASFGFLLRREFWLFASARVLAAGFGRGWGCGFCGGLRCRLRPPRTSHAKPRPDPPNPPNPPPQPSAPAPPHRLSSGWGRRGG